MWECETKAASILTKMVRKVSENGYETCLLI